MHSGEGHSSGPELAGPTGRALRPPQNQPRVRYQHPRAAAHRWWIAAIWIGGGLALLAFLFRISLSFPQDSDGANSALQAWDMLHGNVLLHGWIVGDATFYTFELPLYSITEFLFGLHAVTVHLGAALTYLIVAASAIALARVDSRGLSIAARAGVVIALLAAPLLTLPGVYTLVELPDHTGTAAILLACFLLIDRAPGWRFTPPLVCAILIAGQVGDATVLYVAVPAVLAVCAYRVLATISLPVRVNLRRLVNTTDGAIAVAAVASVPLAILAHKAMVHFGGYLMIAPHTQIAPMAHWAHNGVLAIEGILTLFGAVSQGAALGTAGAVFGLACLLAAVCGFGKVLWTWRTASRAEQLLCLAIVINITVYVISSIPARRRLGARRGAALRRGTRGAGLHPQAASPTRGAPGWRSRRPPLSRCCRWPLRPPDHPRRPPRLASPPGSRPTGSPTASAGTGMPRPSPCSQGTGFRSARSLFSTRRPTRCGSAHMTGRRTPPGMTPVSTTRRS